MTAANEATEAVLAATGQLAEDVALLQDYVTRGVKSDFMRGASGRYNMEDVKITEVKQRVNMQSFIGNFEKSIERLVKEIALFADRTDISEELTRAASHVKQFRAYLDGGAPAGRSLDFLLQEFFREFNTMGSKCNNAEIAHHVVTAKTELEKIREQVQNEIGRAHV